MNEGLYTTILERLTDDAELDAPAAERVAAACDGGAAGQRRAACPGSRRRSTAVRSWSGGSGSYVADIRLPPTARELKAWGLVARGLARAVPRAGSST